MKTTSLRKCHFLEVVMVRLYKDFVRSIVCLSFIAIFAAANGCTERRMKKEIIKVAQPLQRESVEKRTVRVDERQYSVWLDGSSFFRHSPINIFFQVSAAEAETAKGCTVATQLMSIKDGSPVRKATFPIAFAVGKDEKGEKILEAIGSDAFKSGLKADDSVPVPRGEYDLQVEMRFPNLPKVKFEPIRITVIDSDAVR